MPQIERDGVRLNYETRGPASAAPVVLLHGFTSDLRMWHPVAARLESSYHLILPDLRGHGLSESPAGIETYTMDTYAADLQALLDALEVELCVLVGCSFGGMVAMHYALEHHERLAALVLSDTSPAYDHPAYDESFRRREARLAENEDYVRRFGTRQLGNRLARDLNDTYAAQGIRNRYAAMDTEGYLGAAHARRTRPDLSTRLAELPIPVMLVAGMDDPVYSALPVMTEALPRARQVIFKDTGHGVPAIHPHDFSDALVRFFEDLQEGNPVAQQVTVETM